MSDPACRNYRELLGVYVVGAIEPNERGLLEAHLNQCFSCREELAGLAVLPALLNRIPLAEAEELARPDPGFDTEDPAPQVLAHLIDEVRARRRAKRFRTVLAAAAAVIVAVGGSVAVSAELSHHPHVATSLEVVSKHVGGLSGTVKYSGSPWGTQIWTRVKGVPEWTPCKFWITTTGNRTELAGGWLLGPGGDTLWYPTRIDVPANSITRFTLTAHGKVLLSIRA
jgi:hypothetical protein